MSHGLLMLGHSQSRRAKPVFELFEHPFERTKGESNDKELIRYGMQVCALFQKQWNSRLWLLELWGKCLS
jgi:hypothetical protein